MIKDFFISYTSNDKSWAEWIAWILEENGFSTIIQDWDFRPGRDFVLEMDKAATETKQTIAILSDDYLQASFTQTEWAEAFARDPEEPFRGKTLRAVQRNCSFVRQPAIELVMRSY